MKISDRTLVFLTVLCAIVGLTIVALTLGPIYLKECT